MIIDGRTELEIDEGGNYDCDNDQAGDEPQIAVFSYRMKIVPETKFWGSLLFLLGFCGLYSKYLFFAHSIYNSDHKNAGKKKNAS